MTRSGMFDKVLTAYSCGGSRGFDRVPYTGSLSGWVLPFRLWRKAGAFGG